MKKIIGLFILMLSLVLMPSGVNAASYKDYFKIDCFGEVSSEVTENMGINGGGIGIGFRADDDRLVLKENAQGIPETNQVTATYFIETENSKYEEVYKGNFKTEIPQGCDDEECFVILTAIDNNLNKNVSRVVIDVNFDDYKGKLIVDISKATYDNDSFSMIGKKITNVEEIVTEERPKDEVTEVPEENAVVSKDILSEIKASGNKVTYESKTDNKVSYAWIFDGAKMTTNEIDVNLELVVNAKDEVGISKLIPKTVEKPIILDFKHSGVLPVGTRVRVNVSNTYKDGDKVTLYYYNETTKKLEEKVTDIIVKDGNVEFSLEHCSTYTLVRTNSAPNNAYTASMNVYLYSGLSFVSLIGLGVLVKSYKKNS